MKKILLYTDTPQIGGAELQIFLLAKFLDRSKFTPVLACSDYPQLDRWCEDFKKENIEVLRLKVQHKHDPRHFTQLRKIIKEKKIDLLHAHVWNPASCRYAASAAGSTKIPIITTEHDPFKLPYLKDLFKKRSLEKISKIITVSEQNARVLKKLYPEHKSKIKVIHNGIDIDWWQSQLLRFTPEDRREIKEKIFHAKEDTLIITTIGELHERKGHKYLIEALPKLIGKSPNLKVAIVGEGKERDNLQKLINKLGLGHHVTLTGRQNEIPKILKSSNIFVLPSRREAFGLVLAEAMICGLPIVATKVGGVPELVDAGKNAILVEAEANDSLAEALKILINSATKRQKMAEYGQERVIENFNALKMAKEYEKIYSFVSK